MPGNVLADNAGMLLWGLVVTLEISGLALVIALGVGIVVAVMRVAPSRALRAIGTGYVELFRNIPLLVQLFFLFFALPSAGITLPAFWCGVLALGIYTAAFVAEAIRSGIAAVATGQLEAALASGLRYSQAMRLVILPQAIRLTIPPLANTVLNMIKNSSLVSAISIGDILGTANLIGAHTFAYVPLFFAAAVLYLAITLPTAYVASLLERRLAIVRR
jgi:putative glutamine transport system permease protein